MFEQKDWIQESQKAKTKHTVKILRFIFGRKFLCVFGNFI